MPDATQNGWWPIESHPGDDTPVDLWIRLDEGSSAWVTNCFWHDNGWHYKGFLMANRPTHWRSIPGEPRVDGGKK